MDTSGAATRTVCAWQPGDAIDALCGMGAYHAIGLHRAVQTYFGIQIGKYFFRYTVVARGHRTQALPAGHANATGRVTVGANRAAQAVRHNEHVG